jgi:hypothetical protein
MVVMIVKNSDTAATPAEIPTECTADPLGTRTVMFSPTSGWTACAGPVAAPPAGGLPLLCRGMNPLPTAGETTFGGRRPSCGTPRGEGAASAPGPCGFPGAWAGDCDCACPASPGRGATGIFWTMGGIPAGRVWREPAPPAFWGLRHEAWHRLARDWGSERSASDGQVIGLGCIEQDVRSDGADSEGTDPVSWLEERYSDSRILRLENEVGSRPMVNMSRVLRSEVLLESLDPEGRKGSDPSAPLTGKSIRANIKVCQICQATQVEERSRTDVNIRSGLGYPACISVSPTSCCSMR